MKNILLILILALLISCVNEKPKIIPEIIIEANLIHSYDTLIAKEDTTMHKTFEVELSIINKSKEPVSFWIMTCSWNENFLINNDYISFFRWDCDSNFPTIKHLKPNGRLDLKASVLKNDFAMYRIINQPNSDLSLSILSIVKIQRTSIP